MIVASLLQLASLLLQKSFFLKIKKFFGKDPLGIQKFYTECFS